MRSRVLAVSAAVVSAVVVLASCGTGTANQSQASSLQSPASSPQSAASSSGESAVPSSGATSTSGAPQVPADTEVASPVPRSEMPEATGKFGDKPTITVPTTPAPDSLQRVVLSEGDGPVTKAGDTVVVNYFGQVWGGDEFDNSYDRGAPYAVQVGGAQPQVVAGWNVGLQGVKQGSRVMLSFPPRDGYGAAGSPPKIKGTDTLVFVVDIVSVYGVDVFGQADATPQQIPAGWPTVGGKPGGLPTVSVPASLPEPSVGGATLVAKGTGAPAQAGSVLVQYTAVAWDGSHTEQSWPDPTGKDPTAGIGPQSFPLSTSSPFASIIGLPLGSRVLLRTPADSKSGVPAVAWVIDLIAQASATAAG